MSSPIYYPGAALPTAALFPYRMQLPTNNRDRWSSCTGPRSYQFNTGSACCSALGAACKDERPDFASGEKDYYNPSGVKYGDLEFSSSAGPCYPIRGCLSAVALNFDKYATKHAECMCVYKMPSPCVIPEARPCRSELVCPIDAQGQTAIQAMYNTPRGSKERSGALLNMNSAFEC